MKRKRILRAITGTEDHHDGYFQLLRLECGHTYPELVPAKRVGKRKACPDCEFIELYKNEDPSNYGAMNAALRLVPADDRPTCLINWIKDWIDISSAARKYGLGKDVLTAATFVETRSRYPLMEYMVRHLDEDDGYQTAGSCSD